MKTKALESGQETGQSSAKTDWVPVKRISRRERMRLYSPSSKGPSRIRSSAERFFLWYDYDATGRLYEIRYNTTDSRPAASLVRYYYNARGQVYWQRMDNNTFSIERDYNARGFLEKIGDPRLGELNVFGQEMSYDDKVLDGPSTGWSAQKNGNISQLRWANRLLGGTTILYETFGYDSRDQLTKADCSNNSYDVSSYSYDDNGNISGLNRGTAWSYYYDGDEVNTNRLDNVSPLTGDDNWDYDASGRQTKDFRLFRLFHG